LKQPCPASPHRPSQVVFANRLLLNGTIVGDLTTTANPMLLTEVLIFNNPFVFQALLKAITTEI